MTDEQRNTVVQNLRQLADGSAVPDEIVYYGTEHFYRHLSKALGFNDAYVSYPEMFWRLADLIEPRTCHIVPGKCFHPEDQERCRNKDDEFLGWEKWQECEFYGCNASKKVCSECGSLFSEQSPYCKNCGAKVVDGD